MSDKDKPAFVDIGHRSQRLQREAANAHGLTVGGPVGEWVAGCMKAAADSMLKASHEAPADVIQGEARATQADFDLAQSFADTWCDGSKSAAIALVGKLAKHRLAYQSEAPAQGEERAEAIALDVAETITAHMRSPDMIWGLGGIDPELLDEMEAELRSITVAALTNALAPSLPLADREAIARVVDPSLWARRDFDAGRRDYYEAFVKVGWSGMPFEEWVERGTQGSLAKADAILALSGSLPPSPVGEGITTPAPVRGE